MFSETPEEILVELAGILEETEVEAGETIFHKADIGAAMYIIIEGRVRVHDDERTIITLGEKEFFGELAVLDPEPRSASVTALEHTRLFRLDQESLYELMADHIEIVRGINRVLCQRLRSMSKAGRDPYQD
jgi:CRP-like cAMP-binding protein